MNDTKPYPSVMILLECHRCDNMVSIHRVKHESELIEAIEIENPNTNGLHYQSYR